MLRWSLPSFFAPKSGEPGSDTRNPFGGCERLLSQYKCIGTELVRLENAPGPSDAEDLKEFRVAVAYVPVQVLESYLEDLLDLEVSESSLFLFRNRTRGPERALVGIAVAAGLVAAVGAYFVGKIHGGLALGSGALLLLVPFGVACIRPYHALMRRLGFARIVSREIARRRGTDTDHRGRGAGIFLSEIFGGSPLRRGGLSHSPRRVSDEEAQQLAAS